MVFNHRPGLWRTFTIEAPPTKPIVGTVRDRATGKLLAGVRVESQNLPGMMFYPRNALHTQTDAEGRFRLIGMPKDTKPGSEPGNLIRFVPNEDQPFLIRTVAVPDTPGLDPVRLDVDLRRGQWITGRVTDKATGKPVFSRIEYFPWLKNPFRRPPRSTAVSDSPATTSGSTPARTAAIDCSVCLVAGSSVSRPWGGCIARASAPSKSPA